MRIRHNWILFLLLVFGLTGCSSTGYSTKTNLVVPATIRSPENIPSELVQFVPRFVDVLQENGFAVGETEDPRALDLVMEFDGNPFKLRVSASLWREGIPILTASATNSGWGTAISRGSAVHSLADSAVSTFQSELTGLMSRTEIVADNFDKPTSPIFESDRYSELGKLKKLLDDDALTQEEFDQEKAKILAQND